MAAFVFVALVVTLELLTFTTNRLVRRRRSARRGGATPARFQLPLDPEARLVADRVAGRVPALDYHEAMAAIARAEDLRNPLLVPGEGGHDVS